MEACIRYSELPHTSRLFLDYVYSFDRVSRFYEHSPREADAFRKAAAEVRLPAERRAALVAALREQNGDSPLLESLARPATVAVVTGQQTGLFTGPCYTVYKALTAVNLARRLTSEGIEAVPVFWLASEDHDFAEVGHAWVFDARNHPVRLEMHASGAGRRPVGGIPIENAPVFALRESIAGLPFGDDVAAMAERAYAPGETLASAFEKLLRDLLGRDSMLFLDPMRPAFRRLASPVLREAVLRMPELTARVMERGKALEQAGYHAQVLVEPQTSLVFLLDGGERLTLRRQDAEYTANGRRYATAELAGRAEDLSPNALLRPVAQDFMLPTVAYVGGPSEIAYLAQSSVLYGDLLGRQPIAIPRQGATLLDARAKKLRDRYGLNLQTILKGQLRAHIAACLVPPEAQNAVRRTQERIEEALRNLAGDLERFDPTLGEAFARSRRKINYQLQKTGRKVAREALRRDERAQAEADYVEGLVFPEKHLQERLYSILPFVARHGTDLIQRLAAELTPDCPDHRVVVL